MTHSDDEQILRRLSPGDADPILVADFQAMSMAPRLSEMLSERVRGRAVFQIDPIGALSADHLYAPLPELAGACAGEFSSSGADRGRVLVVGHCSAAPLALHVADLLAPARSVTAVLVNPTWPDDDHLTAKFFEFLTRFGPATRPAPDLDADPCLVVSAMEQVFRDEIAALAASKGLSSSAGVFSDLIVWYRAWLAFLLAGRNDTTTERTAAQAAVTVLSDSPSTVTVPGLSKSAFPLRELPPQPVGTVTPELAELVAAHIARC
ncbi:alpha/beta fold hydrolase [Streptomyces sp. SID13031]|uniref:alpha/beta fold hydrolase n=1 Tax=Streptomyces sp. SID13031 TaxID=2706046 RepID=UPI0013C98229|nr:alpha/beta fold hydrolase [Streptomyces sp. SID13031]NEA33584.1 alpha/beta fold hydrolase [Streptomyces sp. SID13031]